MFKKSGTAKFNVCAHKTLNLLDNQADLSCPVTRRTGTTVEVSAGTYARLWNVQKDGDNNDMWLYKSAVHATNELGRAAGAMVCGGCSFYNMSPAEVNATLATEALTEAELLAAEAERARQRKGYLDAIQELTTAHPEEVVRPHLPELPPGSA